MDVVRVTLNPDNGKELVIKSTENKGLVVQILKKDQLQDEYTEGEVKDFYWRGVDVCEKITRHLQSSDGVAHSGHCFSFDSHLVKFIRLRDKPFVVVERENCFDEVRGVPQLRAIHLGLTSWTALCETFPGLFERHIGWDEID